LQLWGPKSMTLASTQHPLRKESMEGITWWKGKQQCQVVGCRKAGVCEKQGEVLPVQLYSQAVHKNSLTLMRKTLAPPEDAVSVSFPSL
jgi:hypothetical protein